MSKFIYFPSFSAGAMGSSLAKNVKLKNDLSIRFYSDEFPEKYRHTDILITAGHHFKKDDYKNDLGLTDKNLVMGDSGGYQIASGAIKWDMSIRERIFKWLEHNSDIAMNLDIPPKIKYEGMYEECLKISKDNFKYFADNQSGNTDFLNVVQGTNDLEYINWYNEMKEYPFQGWAVGGGGRNVFAFMSGVMSLLQGGEHLKDTNKYFHILGISKVKDFLMLNQLQKSLNEVDSKVVVTTDSSSPDRAVVFGSYYHSYDFKKPAFRSINVPKYDDSFKDQVFKHLPVTTEFDREYLREALTWDDTVEWKGQCTMAIRLHNFMVFKEAIEKAEYYVYSHDYIKKQILSNDMYELLESIDAMVKSDKPREVFEKYKPLFKRLSNVKSENETIENKFF
jgi:queuine/archaeosine tRNA-ribosyltransferase|tara:strand:+ start:678 stop:1859 length:1182 start_codon:yes stop_codon:yes gene_type:complete